MKRLVLVAVATLNMPNLLFGATTLPAPFDDTSAHYSLVINGSFEDADGTTLTAFYNAFGDTLFGHDPNGGIIGDGSAALLDQSWSNTGPGIALVQEISVTPGESYVVSSYIKNSLSPAGNAYIDLSDISIPQADGGNGDCSARSTPGLGDWQFVYCQFTVPIDQSSVRVRAVIDATIDPGSHVWFDELALTLAEDFMPPESLGLDSDEDGFTLAQGDCNDEDEEINPEATELCDNIDQDCDDAIDEGTQVPLLIDEDGDGWGDYESPPSMGCPEDVITTQEGDCNDDDSSVYPGATEFCDGINNDCDGGIDEDFDQDGDSYLDAGACGDDCDDQNSNTYPNATEVDDGQDNDCDAIIDEGTSDFDDDGDGFSENDGDCDDNNSNISPAQEDICGDGIDQNCDGQDPTCPTPSPEPTASSTIPTMSESPTSVEPTETEVQSTETPQPTIPQTTNQPTKTQGAATPTTGESPTEVSGTTATEAPSPTLTEAPSPTLTEAPSPTLTEAQSPTLTEAPSPTFTEVPETSESESPGNTDPQASPTPTAETSNTPSARSTFVPTETIEETQTETVEITPTETVEVSATEITEATDSPAPTTATLEPDNSPGDTEAPTDTSTPNGDGDAGCECSNVEGNTSYGWISALGIVLFLRRRRS